jgi:dephospho-CoA kinase
MKVWIVTGGVASGKSQFCTFLNEAVPLSIRFDSDRTVHELLGTRQVAEAVADEFGRQVLDATGRVDRQALRAVVFGDDAARKRLESLLHPSVYQALGSLRHRLEGERNTQLLIAEVPLFYESVSEFPADLVIVVATEASLQQQRLTGPRKLDPDTAGRIRSAQWPLSRKLEPADVVVWNEGSLPLLRLQATILAQQLNLNDGQ